MKRLLLALCFALAPALAQAASCGSYPFTLQNNTTADATQVMADFNTVRNCVINNAAGSGVNTDITSITGLSTPLSVPQGGSPVFIGGTSTGTNTIAVASTSPIGYSLTNGYRVSFTALNTNTAAATLNVNSTGATAIRKVGASGLEALTGGEIVAGNIIEALYNGTFFVLLTVPVPNFNLQTNLNSSSADLGTVPSHNVRITGTTTITSFGSTAVATNPIYFVAFSTTLTLTYNATSLIIPGSADITTANGDTATAEYLGSGNWRILQYTRRSGANVVPITPLCGAIGFLAQNNSGTPNTSYDLSAGSATMVNTSGVTVNDTSVSVTVNATVTGANGLDAGSLANSTWYYGWLISTGSTTAGLLSTSSTAPTMPSTYTYKCRLSAIRTDGSAHFQRIRQRGAEANYVVSAATTTALPVLDSGIKGSLTVPTWASVATGSFVPTTATHIFGVLHLQERSATTRAMAAPNNLYGAYNSDSNPPPVAAEFNGGGAQDFMANLPFRFSLESTNIYWASASANDALLAYGWKDNVNAN